MRSVQRVFHDFHPWQNLKALRRRQQCCQMIGYNMLASEPEVLAMACLRNLRRVIVILCYVRNVSEILSLPEK